MKKIIVLISVVAAAVLACTSIVMLSGCGEKDYPLEIGGITFEKEPENVVVLDAAAADIMAYMTFDRKLAARSDAVTQPELAEIPSVGSETDPDITQIREKNADLVLCSERISEDAEATLRSYDIPVIKLQIPNTPAEVKTNYGTIAKILAGKNKGAAIGRDSYAKLLLSLEKQKREIEPLSGTGELSTVCYLYLQDKKLEKLTSGSYGNILMGYTNCVNIFSAGNNDLAVSPTEDTINTVVSANPDYIFCSDEATLKAIAATPSMKKLNAVKGKKCWIIPLEDMCRPGITAGKTVATMIRDIYGDNAAAAAQQVTTQKADTKQAATEATTAPAEDLSAKYKINLNGLNLKKDQENNNVKIMQKRLSDLGYLKPQGNDTNITGYYGDLTEAAVKAFQKAHGIKETGDADNATLVVMFRSDAKLSPAETPTANP